MLQSDQSLAAVSSAEYRAAISCFLTGVSVVATRHRDMAHGITASAVASVTLEPPTLLVCLNRHSATGAAVLASGHFSVNILDESQQDLARHFASKIDDKFAAVAHTSGCLGDPLLRGALAALECRVSQLAEVGSHHVFFGEVLRVSHSDGKPLAYHRGQFLSITG